MSDYFIILPCAGYFQVGMSLIHTNVKITRSFYLISFYISYLSYSKLETTVPMLMNSCALLKFSID